MEKKSIIYTALGLDGYELCQPINQSDLDRIPELINGKSQQENWEPIKVKIIKKEEGKTLIKSDAPWSGVDAFMIFTDKVVDVLGTFLRKYGELLELKNKESNLYIYNPFLCENAVDIEKSELMKLGSGKIISITKYVFNKEIISNLGSFKIDNLRVSPTFFNQEFVDEWNKNGFEGLEFIKIWEE
jgi:hypothetical protein